MAHYFFSGTDPESLDVIEPSQETEETNTTDQGNLLRSIENKTVTRGEVFYYINYVNVSVT